MTTTRRDLTAALKRVMRRFRRGAYYTKRGALVWHADSWRGKDRGAGIMFSDFTVLRETNEATVTIHLMARIEDTTGDREVDDGVMDEIGEDAENLMVQLQGEKNAAGDDILLTLDQEGAGLAEVFDPDTMVQGLILSFDVTYQ